MRIILLGNAGSGKSTLARKLAGTPPVACLSLDDIAWDRDACRKPFEDSLALLREFMASADSWVIEGCYGDLIDAALPSCERLIFLNPGVDACAAQCRTRPWEPEKFDTPEAQAAALRQLLEWVRTYDLRSDEYGLSRHRRLFESFPGEKQEYRRVQDYPTV